MIKLLTKTAAAGLTPIKISNTTIIEIDALTLTSISANKGESEKLSEQLKKSHGMSLPHSGRASGREGARALWFGQHTLLVCLLYTSPSPRDKRQSRMPSSA